MAGRPRSTTRAFERELIQTEALVVEMRDSGTGRSLQGRSRNLSPNGIFVETPEEGVDVGDEVQLFIGKSQGADALRLLARVVHVHPGIGFGAQFVQADEAVRGFIERVKKKE